jgi:hypothetical protein
MWGRGTTTTGGYREIYQKSKKIPVEYYPMMRSFLIFSFGCPKR